jgi:hypothetical protein
VALSSSAFVRLGSEKSWTRPFSPGDPKRDRRKAPVHVAAINIAFGRDCNLVKLAFPLVDDLRTRLETALICIGSEIPDVAFLS